MQALIPSQLNPNIWITHTLTDLPKPCELSRPNIPGCFSGSNLPRENDFDNALDFVGFHCSVGVSHQPDSMDDFPLA